MVVTTKMALVISVRMREVIGYDLLDSGATDRIQALCVLSLSSTTEQHPLARQYVHMFC